MRDGFSHEFVKRGRHRCVNHANHDVPFALHGTDDDEFPSSTRSAEVAASALAAVPVLGFPADVGFIHIDPIDEL